MENDGPVHHDQARRDGAAIRTRHEDLLVTANRPGGGEEIRRIEVLVDEADPRVFRVVEIPVGDRVDAGIRVP